MNLDRKFVSLGVLVAGMAAVASAATWSPPAKALAAISANSVALSACANCGNKICKMDPDGGCRSNGGTKCITGTTTGKGGVEFHTCTTNICTDGRL